MIDPMTGLDITSQAHARIVAQYDRVARYMFSDVSTVMYTHTNGSDEEKSRVQKWLDYDTNLTAIRSREPGIVLDDEPEPQLTKVMVSHWREMPLRDKIQHGIFVAVSIASLIISVAIVIARMGSIR